LDPEQEKMMALPAAIAEQRTKKFRKIQTQKEQGLAVGGSAGKGSFFVCVVLKYGFTFVFGLVWLRYV
jgi:hypothetical protein